MNEGNGPRSPNANGLRSKLLAEFSENPRAIMTRPEIIDRHQVTVKTMDKAVSMLKRDGYIVSLAGPHGKVGYALVNAPQPAKTPKPIRNWPASTYSEPRPIPTSVFNFASTL